jgi:hypothetical protein
MMAPPGQRSRPRAGSDGSTTQKIVVRAGQSSSTPDRPEWFEARRTSLGSEPARAVRRVELPSAASLEEVDENGAFLGMVATSLGEVDEEHLTGSANLLVRFDTATRPTTSGFASRKLTRQKPASLEAADKIDRTNPASLLERLDSSHPKAASLRGGRR